MTDASAHDLYARDPIRVDTDVRELKGCYFDHLPEVPSLQQYADPIEQDRIQLRVVAEEWQDARRFWRVMTVWFKARGGQGARFDLLPVMVCTNGGREGDDHARRYVTAPLTLTQMCRYLAELTGVITPRDNPASRLVELDEIVPEMTHFYGWHAFERTGFAW